MEDEVAQALTTKTIIEIVADWVDPALDELKGLHGRERLIAKLREIIRRDFNSRSEVIKDAEGGNLLCHQALRAEYEEMLDKHELPPATLTSYMLHGKKPRRRPGRHTDEWDHRQRDIAVGMLAAAVRHAFDLELNHNPANDRPCATDVVSAALRLKGIKLSPKRVSAIVTKENRRLSSWLGLPKKS